MAQLSEAEIKAANDRRQNASRREKAEQLTAQEEASNAAAWYHFLKSHSGVRGSSVNGGTGKINGAYLACEANNQILSDWLAENDEPVTVHSLEEALWACRDRLAKSPEPYNRKTDTQKSRIVPQSRYANLGAPPNLCPYTKAEIRAWSAQQLKKAIRHYGVDEINRVLNSN